MKPETQEPPSVELDGPKTESDQMTLPEGHLLRKFGLDPCPERGSGVHKWIFKAACKLWPQLDDENQIFDVIWKLAERQDEREISEAIRNSNPGNLMRTCERMPAWPALDKSHRVSVANGGPSVANLLEASPVQLPDAEAAIDLLYPKDCLICAGKENSRFDTRPREEWRGQLSRLQFVVPSPMSAIEGIKKSGGISRHCEANTGPRRYIIVEFDSGAFDEHAALHWHLARFMPLCCVTFSGAKSLHGWYSCEGKLEAATLRFFRYSVSIGADPALWRKSQFTRMPGGLRPGAADLGLSNLPPEIIAARGRQTVIFLNPSFIP